MDNKSFRNLDRLPGGRRSRKLADEVGWGVRIAWLKNRKQQRMALASFPRSGNTWFRLFLENATDRPTGNARRGPDGFSDPVEVLVRSGRPDAMDDNPADVAIKTHALDSYRYTHAIHLVRSPFDVLDSFYDWKRSSGWQWRHGELAWEPFVKLIAPRWRDHTRHWLDARCATYRIRYEDCRRDPVTSFADLLGWMGIEISRSVLAQAVEATAFEKLKKTQIGSSAVRNNFFRRGQVNRGIERFSPEQRQWLVRLARQELLACGYHDLVKSVDAGETMPARKEQ